MHLYTTVLAKRGYKTHAIDINALDDLTLIKNTQNLIEGINDDYRGLKIDAKKNSNIRNGSLLEDIRLQLDLKNSQISKLEDENKKLRKQLAEQIKDFRKQDLFLYSSQSKPLTSI